MTQVRFDLVLPLDESLEAVTPSASSAIDVINEKLDLAFRRVEDEATGPGVVSRKWVDRYAGEIALVQDSIAPALYVTPFLRISYGHQTMFNTFESFLRTVPAEALRDQAERGEPNRATALTRLGLGETEDHDPRTVRILVAGLQDPAIEVRRAAALSVFLLRWSAFRTPLRNAIAAERDVDLREQLITAERYLESSVLV